MKAGLAEAVNIDRYICFGVSTNEGIEVTATKTGDKDGYLLNGNCKLNGN